MEPLDKDYLIENTQDYIHSKMTKPSMVLSSAVLNGGFIEAEHILNLKVPLQL